LPDRRHGIDTERPPTPLEHLVADHAHGPEASRAQHYREWVELVDVPLGNATADQVGAKAASLQGRGYSIHFHCWTLEEFAAQLRRIIAEHELPATVTLERANYHEFLVVLTRTA